MLVQFKMRNVLSFKEEALLDMTAIPAYKEHSYNYADVKNGHCEEKILRVAAIYGANASGKSNFYCGMRMFQTIVLNSMNTADEIRGNALESCYFPFAFTQNAGNCEFEIVSCTNEAEYTYGFEYNADTIVSEWLYRKDFQTNRASTIVERSMDDIRLGFSVRKECVKYKSQIPKETLVLTFMGKLRLKTTVFSDLFSEIRKMMIVDTGFFEDKRVIERFLPDVIDNRKKDLLRFLSAIDSGIQDVSYETIDRKIEFFTFHKGSDGSLYRLNLYNESQGTLKSVIIFMIASSVIAENGLMVVDELNAKLHPLLLKFIVDLFYDQNSMAQLVYTTHDTTLLDKKFFRRDQIWFVDKDGYGCSRLSALSDFKIRSDASFEKDYLSGVYGGIPMLKNFSVKAGSRNGK